jgi:hypothetical protein
VTEEGPTNADRARRGFELLQTVSGRSSGTPVPFHYGGIGRWRDGRLELVENHPDLDRARAAFDQYASVL